MRPIPHAAGLYLAVLQLVFALGWTIYAFYLPQLAVAAGISRSSVIYILMLDQAIFTISDFAVGVATDRVSQVLGRVGHWVAAVTLLSCAAFVGLPFIAKAGVGPTPFLALVVLWAVTSSALRAPPLMLLGKYAEWPALPYLASLATLGVGIAGALGSYLTMALSKQDPRLPFILSSVVLVLTSLALVKIERMLAKQAPKAQEPPKTIDRAVPAPITVLALTSVIFAIGFQLHFFFNSAMLLGDVSDNVGQLMPVFWIGFSIGMFPVSFLTERWGGLPVMGAAGLLGAGFIAYMEATGTFGGTVTAQLLIGAAWGCILMSAFSAAAAIGTTGSVGKTTGVLYAMLALATFGRMAATANGVPRNPTLAPLLAWAPILCWGVAGALLLLLCLAYWRRAGNPIRT
jgi:hypothetical protein